MKQIHIIKNENLEIYKKLMSFYEEKDFKTQRTDDEKKVEFEIINELPNYIISVLDNVSSNNYLEKLSKMDSSTPGFSNFLKAVKGSLDTMISCTEKK